MQGKNGACGLPDYDPPDQHIHFSENKSPYALPYGDLLYRGSPAKTCGFFAKYRYN